MRIDSGKKRKVDPPETKIRKSNSRGCVGSLKVVGIGPGDVSNMSQKAVDAISDSDVIIGYKTYIGLLGRLVRDKEVIASGMTDEVSRARLAIKKAKAGSKVCVISGGDAGLYGMAGLMLELMTEPEIKKLAPEIVPGIPASSSVAGLLGAPLANDFAAISLSDLLTDKSIIMRRVEAAARGDFVIVFYNPRSAKRVEPLKEAWSILMKYRLPQTPIGVVRNAYRDGQMLRIVKLKDMLTIKEIDMLSTVIVGNSKTYVKAGSMITPRGYLI